ncbi:RNA polymerase sigma factor [Chitinophaga vietnamensis]|uniref:RNA polymerase sigma factor n=1 Tax=Chitinophaga vietnamensis TaxID=2593957 RepID=UPI0011786315|nr:sigma-70 family RNA polymerase sigma factor [Chitinophaga vietnamensis]
MNHLQDQELITLLKQGDHHAYEQLFNRYWKTVFTIAHQKCGDEQDALDIVQHIFSYLWENRAALTIRGSLAAWLTAVVKYKVIDYYRTNKKQEAQLAQLLLQLESQSAMHVRQENKLAYQQLKQDWETAVEALPGRMKEVYLMSTQSELSIAEISRRLSLKPQSVKNHLFKAREKLRKLLEHHLILFL